MTLPRIRRLDHAREWVKTYSGSRIVKSYSRKYAVDKLSAIKELRLIGVEITQEYEHQIKKSIEDLREQRQLRKEKMNRELHGTDEFDSDENFAFIAAILMVECHMGLLMKKWMRLIKTN